MGAGHGAHAMRPARNDDERDQEGARSRAGGSVDPAKWTGTTRKPSKLTHPSPHRLRGRMTIIPLALLQGTLDLLVLRCLSAGPRHGYAIATMVREHTGGDLSVEDAALYQALHRLH